MPSQFGGIPVSTQDVPSPAPAPMSASALPQQPVTGDAFLKTLPLPLAAQVKAMSEGRQQLPSSFVLKTPYGQALMGALARYDPDGYDYVSAGSRYATRKDFTSGKAAQNIRALNTAIGHLGTLNQQIPGTASHGGFPLATAVNWAENEILKSAGDPGITNFDQTRGALASELTQVFRGSGGAEADIARELEHLSPNASEAQKRASVKNIAELLNSRLEALGDQYKQGMGVAKDPLELLHPKAKKSFLDLINHIVEPEAKPAQKATSGPKPGTVEDGYRFKGGNPADPKSWEMVK